MSRTLHLRASFWVAATVAGLALWGSAAPSVAYPLYARTWHLTPTATTAIFAVYPVALIPVLLVFGNLSDVLGRRTVMLLGVLTLTAGSLALALAPDLAWVFAGRALMGVGVGLALGPATAAMVEFGEPRRASAMTTAATATGLALATLIGGALVQYGPDPMHLSFWVLFVVTLGTATATWFLPRRTVAVPVAWRPRGLHLPRASGVAFLAGALGVAAAYACGAVFLALGAQIARDLVRSENALLNGAIISVSAVSIGAVAILSRRVAPRRALAVGSGVAVVGFAALITAGLTQSLPLFIGAAVVSGTSYSLLFSGGLGLVSAGAPAEHRAATLSAAYSIAYLVQAGAAIGLGAVATAAGLERALELGSPLIVALALVAAVLGRAGSRVTPPGLVPAGPRR